MDALEDFWSASSLDPMGIDPFSARLLSYVAAPGDRYTPAGPPIVLRPVTDRLQRLFAARRSERSFDERPLTHRQVTAILAATGPRPSGGRVVPEAGGFGAVQVYAFVRHARGPLHGQVVRYDHTDHTAAPVAPVPSDARLLDLFQLDVLPQVVLAFVVDLTDLTGKYGSRGGRFALQQVGHAAQNVSLRLAADRLRGYVVGGGLDHEILTELHLAHTDAHYAGAMACGR